MSGPTRSIVVVPCYNEAARFRADAFTEFSARAPAVSFLFVDDGSTDATAEVLSMLAQRDPEHFRMLALDRNRGKAEAVRAGVLAAFEADPARVGYWDADLATPLSELLPLLSLLEENPQLLAAFGSRVKLLGRSIERSALRHYAGRVVATAISRTLELSVYDTQCGAKLFRATPEVRELFEEPFVAGWTFDVEILARLLARRGSSAADLVWEYPLQSWRDVAGSKVRPRDFARAFVELRRIRARYLRASRAGS